MLYVPVLGDLRFFFFTAAPEHIMGNGVRHMQLALHFALEIRVSLLLALNER